MATFEQDAVVPGAREADRPVAVHTKAPFTRWLRRTGWRHIVAIIAVGFALFPVAWIVSSSVNTVDNLTSVSFFPTGYTFDNYTGLFEGCSFGWGFPPFACDTTTPVPVWLFNTVKIGLIATALQLVFSTLAAYSFARLRWRGRRSGLIAILLIQMFPQFLAFVAIFLLLDILEDTFPTSRQIPMLFILVPALLVAAGFAWARWRDKLKGGLARAAPWVMGAGGGLAVVALLTLLLPASSGSSWFNLDFGTTVFPKIGFNTHTGLILVYLSGAIGVNTWLIKGFMDSIPTSLDEAAKVDGATEWDVFWRIVLPLARPILIVIFVISFIGLYNEFILADILIQDVDQFTYAPGLNLFVESEYSAKWGALSAAAILGAAPIIMLFLALQDRIVGGLEGAVKG